MPYVYDTEFLEYTERSSRHAAEKTVARLRENIDVASVLDVGCARGTWLTAWRDAGVADVFGVDGAYVDRSTLRIGGEHFRATDLAQPFDLGRRFALVQTLEVAEHIPAAAAQTFVDNLVRHASGVILFSAAPPGQGGEFHVNEQPYDYWRARFATYGYVPYDCVRAWLANDAAVSFWYQFNPLLYANDAATQRLSAAILATRVPWDVPIVDVAPLWYRVRKSLVRTLPFGMQQALARLKARLHKSS
jgi:SAM-dependent methyltransferase